jgi:hypothetical protein
MLPIVRDEWTSYPMVNIKVVEMTSNVTDCPADYPVEAINEFWLGLDMRCNCTGKISAIDRFGLPNRNYVNLIPTARDFKYATDFVCYGSKSRGCTT